MLRALRIILVVLLIGCSALAVAWYLAFGVGRSVPGRMDVAGLAAPAEIHWLEGGDAVVTLGRPEDEPAALGAVHALGAPWSLVVLRQAAMGRLAEWFGEPAARFDRHVWRVGVPSRAQEDWDALGAAGRLRLAGYAAGVNASLRTRRVGQSGPLTALGVEPEPWEPWHSLAVTRMVEWLAAPAPTDSVVIQTADSTGEGISEFGRLLAYRDSLASFLALSGLEHAAAWSAGTDAEGLHVRFVWGHAAEPPVRAVRLEGIGSARDVVTWLGTPFPLAYRDAEGAFASIPAVPLELRRDSSRMTFSWSRFEVGSERTEVVERRTDGPWIAVDDRAHGLRFRWGSPSASASVLLGSRAIRLGGGGILEIDPAFATRSAGSVVLSLAPERFELARSVDMVRAGATLMPSSQWARDGLAALMQEVAIDSSGVPADSDAVTYLRNWDAAYQPASIGATLFEPLAGARMPVGRRLAGVIDSLTVLHGSDRRTWRWERDSSSWLRLPGGPGSGVTSPIPNRFGPVALNRRGHPTAPSWGSSPRWVRQPAPAAWEGYLPLQASLPLSFRRPIVPYDEFLGRFSASPEPEDFRPLIRPTSPSGTTRLLPLR